MKAAECSTLGKLLTNYILYTMLKVISQKYDFLSKTKYSRMPTSLRSSRREDNVAGSRGIYWGFRANAHVFAGVCCWNMSKTFHFLNFRKGEIIQKYLFEKIPRHFSSSLLYFDLNLANKYLQGRESLLHWRMEIWVVEITEASLSYSNECFHSPFSPIHSWTSFEHQQGRWKEGKLITSTASGWS